MANGGRVSPCLGSDGGQARAHPLNPVIRLPRLTYLIALQCIAGLALRAQLTEVPETVAPGRFLFEIDAVSLHLDRDGADRATGFILGSTLVSTGLTATWDIQVGADLYHSHKETAGGLTERRSGVGDLYVRTKWRFFEDTVTGLSIALLPHLKIPTNSGGVGNGHVEGGVIVPVRLALAKGLDFAAMTGVDCHRNAAGNGYDPHWHGSAQLGVSLAPAFSLYGEAYLAKSADGSPWEGTLGAGLVFQPREGLSWDLAIYRGVTGGASDWNPVLRCNIGF